MDDLREHLYASIGAGPAHRDLAPLLAAGHRAVRRRRIAAGASALVVVAVVGTSVAVASGRPDAAQDPQPAGQTTSTPSPTPEPDPPVKWRDGDYAAYVGDQLEIRPGVKVLDRVDDYLAGLPKYRDSVALDVTFEGTEHWVTAELMSGGYSGAGVSEPSDGWADFRAWVADQAAANGADVPGGTGYPDLVTVMPDGSFGIIKGVDLIDQTTADLPGGFTRAAYVALDGKRYLVMSRAVGDGYELITIHAEPHGTTLDALLAYARDKYASGEGVR